MNSRLIAAIIAASVLATGCSGPARTEPDAGDTALAANAEAFAARLAASDDFSGVVLLARHGRPLLRRGFGLADRKAGRPNTPETAFALSSVSKMFTAVTIAKLVERGQLSFDATLGSLLPEYPSAEAREQVTVRHLLTMSSGIPDLFRIPAFWAEISTIKTAPDFWKYFATSPLDFRPGTRWAYSNSNFLLLGAIIERRLGRAFILWSKRRCSVLSDWRTHGTRSIRPGSPRSGTRGLHRPAVARIRPAGIRHGRSPSQGTTSSQAARWAAATPRSTTSPVLRTH